MSKHYPGVDVDVVLVEIESEIPLGAEIDR